jgi:hypothetical protein
VNDGSVTLALGGTVSLSAFAKAVRSFQDLLGGLTSEVSPEAHIDWVLAGLDYGSAVTTAQAVPLDEQSERFVPRVVDAYLEAAEAVAYGQSTVRSPRILRLVSDLTGLIDGGIVEVRFETAEREAVFSEPLPGVGPKAPSRPKPAKALGSIRGRVQTLHARGGLRFTLYDAVNDKAVSCYLTSGQEEMMRGVWGHLAEVEGMVSRDPLSDRPLSVRQVSSIVVIDEGDRDGFLRARGVVSQPADAPPSEAVIRKLRDAG